MRHTLAVVLAALAIVGCEQPREEKVAAPAHHSVARSAAMDRAEASPSVQAQVARLRALTASFHRKADSEEAGWNAKITDCFSDPNLGGMGFHYGKPELIDGKVDALEPELLLYEPQKDGSLRFVAVEYIVPFTAWTEPQPPELYGVPFHRNEAFGLWVLHVWHFRQNPSGLFMDWNPQVSCQYADRVE